jgi:hypothetical protein
VDDIKSQSPTRAEGQLQLTNQAKSKPKTDLKQQAELCKQMQVKTRDEFIRNVLKQHQTSLQNASYYYQVTYCETRYSHRTINFEVDADHQSDFLVEYRHFEDELKSID